TPKHDTQHGSLPRSHRICSINPTVKPRATRKARRKRWWSWVEKAAARLRFDLRGASGLEEQFQRLPKIGQCLLGRSPLARDVHIQTLRHRQIAFPPCGSLKSAHLAASFLATQPSCAPK